MSKSSQSLCESADISERLGGIWRGPHRPQSGIKKQGRRVPAAGVLLLLVCLCLAPHLNALNPSRNLDQYYHETWTSQRGLPGEAVYQIVQSSDGYLWLRTSAGLVRFDGVRFVRMDDVLGHEPVKAIANTSDHLLIRTTSRTLIYTDGRFTDYRPVQPLPDGEIRGVFESSNHEVLVGSDDFIYGIGLYKIRMLQTDTSWINAFLEGSDRTVWIGGNYGLYSYRNGALSVAADARKTEGVFALARDHAQNFWVGTPHGLFRLHQNPTALEPFGTGVLRKGINQIFEDRQHNLWVGTSSSGLVRVNADSVTSFNTTEGLSDNNVYALFEDREGNLWVGTANGLDRFRDTKITALTMKEGLPSNDTSTAIATRDGSVYVLCSYGGLTRIKNGKVVSVLTKIPGLSSIHGGSLFEDKKGRLWLGAVGALTMIEQGKITVYRDDPRLAKEYISSINEDDEGLILGTSESAVFRFKDGRTYPFLVHGNKTALTDPGNYIFAMYRQSNGTVWFGTVKGLFRYDPGTLPKRQPGVDFPVTTISDDEAGNLWLGGRIPGITRLRVADGQVARYLKSAGLFNAYAFRVLPDNRGNLWMGTADGIYEAESRQLDDYANGRSTFVHATRYGTADGMKTSEANFAALGSGGCKSTDGMLWFTTVNGMVEIDPFHLAVNGLVPSVVVESVSADNLQFTPGTVFRIPPGKDKIELRYTALSLRIPERVNFKYRLQGYDQDWVDAGQRRVAYYNNLPPGSYTFRVIAQNDDGVWNSDGAVIQFILEPRYYQTAWFHLLCLAFAATLVLLVVRFNTRRLRVRAAELEQLVSQRTMSLQVEVAERQRAEKAAIKARESMRFQATHDPLTSFLNRGAILENLHRELGVVARDDMPIAVFMADLDHFKEVNDRYGHLVGDEVLKEIGNRLTKSVRPYDFVGRYGGEEFLILLPNCKAADAKVRAEALCRIVRETPVDTAAGPLSISVSIGVVSADKRGTISPDEVLREADAALYAAKRAGRDCCIAFTA